MDKNKGFFKKKCHKWNAASVFLQKQFYKQLNFTLVKKNFKKTDVSDCSPSSEGFHLLENSPKLCRGFHEAMKARRTCFISFIKLLIFELTERMTLYEVRLYSCISFMKLGHSQPYRSRHFRVSQRYKNTLVDQSKCTYYPNYFINKIKEKHPFNESTDLISQLCYLLLLRLKATLYPKTIFSLLLLIFLI